MGADLPNDAFESAAKSKEPEQFDGLHHTRLTAHLWRQNPARMTKLRELVEWVKREARVVEGTDDVPWWDL